jgi:hypothetical protein
MAIAMPKSAYAFLPRGMHKTIYSPGQKKGLTVYSFAGAVFDYFYELIVVFTRHRIVHLYGQ